MLSGLLISSGIGAGLVAWGWGVKWGMEGYCMMPYEYLISPQLSSDFWTLRSVKEK